MNIGKKIKNGMRQLLSRLPFVAVFFLFISANAATYYSRNSANWNVNSTWSTAGYGGASASSYPQVNDTAKIGNLYTVTINTNVSVAQLDIGQGLTGSVVYSGAGTYTLAIGGNLTLNFGASLIYNTNSSKTHVLQVGGNITNNGSIDLYYDANDIVNLTFINAATSIVSGNGTWALNNVTINKTASTNIVEVQVAAFEAAIATFTGTTGTYIHNNSGSYSVNSASASDFAINQNMVYKVPQGTMWFSPSSNRTYLYGSLYVNGGTVYIGSTAGNNGMRYDKVGSNVPYLEISSGTLDVYGGISYASGAGTNPFNFKMTGGTMLLNNGTSGTAVEVFLVNDAPSSVFYMSGGTITLQDHNSSPGNNCVDWGICGTFGTVTSIGGTVIFGNSSTPNGTAFDFDPNPDASQPNFKVTGTTAAAITLQTAKSSTSDFSLLSLYIDTNKTFDITSIQGTPGNSKSMALTGTYDGVYAYYSRGTFTARSGTVVMQGTAAQTIGGTVSATFNNLTIYNSAGVRLDKTENVSNLLTMTSGLLNTTAAKIITLTSTADATIGNSTSYVNGPMIQTVASSSTSSRNFPLGKGSSYRPTVLTVKHSNSTSVTYTGEMFNSSATALGYAKPATISKVSYTRYWNFARQSVANFTNATMTLYYDLDDTVSNKSRVAVVHDNGSSSWVDFAGTATANNTGNIVSTSITSFNTKFALGFPPSGLPIQLLSFIAMKTDNSVHCNWITSSEINNDYFTVERSVNGTDFDSLGSVKGQGNSNQNIFYQFEDKNPIHGSSYYRLRQTDYDGTTTHSDLRYVYFESSETSYALFPNPSPGKIHVTRGGASMEGVNILVQDMNGKQVNSETHLSIDKNELCVDISPESNIADDFYVLNIITAEGIKKEKILVEKK